MAHVTIAIASCGRGSLADTLASIEAQAVPEAWTVEVVVADDSLDGSAAAITKAAGISVPVQVIAVASRNIAQARNACLDAARGEYIIFIDDDEIAGPAWI
ncbi:MAG: glycosyltransferase, partial [Pseudomonadota bacterium]